MCRLFIIHFEQLFWTKFYWLCETKLRATVSLWRCSTKNEEDGTISFLFVGIWIFLGESNGLMAVELFWKQNFSKFFQNKMINKHIENLCWRLNVKFSIFAAKNNQNVLTKNKQITEFFLITRILSFPEKSFVPLDSYSILFMITWIFDSIKMLRISYSANSFKIASNAFNQQLFLFILQAFPSLPEEIASKEK